MLEEPVQIESFEQLGLELGQKLLTWTEGAESAVSEHAPLFVQEIITAEIVLRSVCSIAAVLVFLTALVLCLWMLRQLQKTKDEMYVGLVGVCIAGTLGAFTIAVGQGYCLTYVLIAPRVFIVKQLSEML